MASHILGVLLRGVISGPAICPIGMLHLRRNFFSDQSWGGTHEGMYKLAGKFLRHEGRGQKTNKVVETGL